MKFGKYSLGCGVLGILVACSLGTPQNLRAQEAEPTQKSGTPQTQTPAPQVTDPSTTAVKPDPASQPRKDDRLFFALPNLWGGKNPSSLPPFKTKQKLRPGAQGFFDPVKMVFVGTR